MAYRLTSYPEIDDLLAVLLSEMQAVLGRKLIGVYLFGSLVWGDFDDDISDIDLLVATASDIDEEQFGALDQMQRAFVGRNTRWDDRIEIAYLSLIALQTFKSQPSKIAIISPGEPFHIKDAGRDWLINWYIVQEKGRTLFGPEPQTLIDPISKQEFIGAVREQAKAWGDWVFRARSRKAQAYTILTMCRALHASRRGEQVSKRQAALWAVQELPEWSALINDALVWRAARNDATVDHDATFPETLRFVQFIIAHITS